jgi:hypothetical protein
MDHIPNRFPVATGGVRPVFFSCRETAWNNLTICRFAFNTTRWRNQLPKPVSVRNWRDGYSAIARNAGAAGPARSTPDSFSIMIDAMSFVQFDSINTVERPII